jgi:RNA 2',3'-cyclic 3'-phosphodiesterase
MRMFVAVLPDQATLELLSRLELVPVEGLRVVRAAQWHITLRFLGEVVDDLVPSVIDAITEAAGSVAEPVRCQIGPGTTWFSGDRVLQLPVAGLDEAAATVRAATLPVVPDPGSGDAPFSGHLTIARSKNRRMAGPARDALAGIPFSATFDVDRFELVASETSAEGRRYATVARVPLWR